MLEVYYDNDADEVYVVLNTNTKFVYVWDSIDDKWKKVKYKNLQQHLETTKKTDKQVLTDTDWDLLASSIDISNIKENTIKDTLRQEIIKLYF
jgi:hypothetical protein